MKNVFRSVSICILLAAPLAAQPARSQVQSDVSDRPLIDVESYAVEATLIPGEYLLTGKADIKLKQLDRRTYAVFDLDRRLKVSAVTIGEGEARFRQFDIDSTVEVDLSGAQFGTGDPVVHIEYSGVLDAPDDRRDPILARVSDENAFLLYEGKWFPTNGLYKDPAQMSLKITAPPDWNIVADLPKAADGFASSQPSYWGVIAAGRYTPAESKSARSEITVHTLNASPEAVTPLAEEAGKVLDFYTETFGPAASPAFRIVEVTGANWNSRWSIGTLLLPSSQFRKDFDTAELARTIAHQWFPLKVAVKDPSADAWLVDGMAVFASLMYFEKMLSPAEAQNHIDMALVKALGYEGDTSIRDAGGMDKDSPEYHSLVEYKGGFVLRMLKWVVGDESFQKLMAEYVNKYSTTPASTEAFTQLASTVAGGDMTWFFDQWVNSSGVPEMASDWTVFRGGAKGYKVMGTIKQDLDLFRMPVELQVVTDGEPEYARVDVSGEASEFEILAERKPKSIVIDPRKRILRMSDDIRVSVLINRGEEFANQGQYNDAIDEYQKAVDIDRLNSLALFRMAEALFELGNLQAAAQEFRQAINGDLKPKWVEVWAYLNLGKIYDIRGDRERAMGEYRKAVSTGDDSFGAQGEAEKFLKEPFRRTGRPTIGD
jgi:hypothetical protein